MLEIGPGIGTMTQYLAETAGKVVAVEIDKALIPILEETLGPYENVTVLQGDILKVNIGELAEKYHKGKPLKVVANLPYYITTPIIMGLFEKKVPLDSITVMVQKEVAERMRAKPGTKDYGALSLAVQYYAVPQIVANVPPNCFMPRPAVGSAVVKLTCFEKPPVEVKSERFLFALIRAAFNQRRKMLINALTGAGGIDVTKDRITEALENWVFRKRYGERNYLLQSLQDWRTCFTMVRAKSDLRNTTFKVQYLVCIVLTYNKTYGTLKN